MGMWKQLIYHDKQNNKLFDYYSEDDDGVVTYIFKVDWVKVRKESIPLNEVDIGKLIKYYSSL